MDQIVQPNTSPIQASPLQNQNIDTNSQMPNASQKAKLPGPVIIFRQAWEIYKNRFWVLLGITLLPSALFIAYFVFLAGSLGAAGFLILQLKLGVSITPAAVIAATILAVLVYLAIIYVSLWAQTALIFAIKGAEQKVGFKEAFKEASHKIGSFFGAAFLSGLASVGVVFLYLIYIAAAFALPLFYDISIPSYVGYLLAVVCIIFAVYFSIRFSLSTFVVVGDNAKALPAVKRSADYVTGYWWPVFWRFLFMAVFAFALSLAVLLLGLFLASVLKGAAAAISIAIPALFNVILYAILPPLFLAYFYQLYFNLKLIKGESKIPADQSSALLITVIVLVLIALVVGAFVFITRLPSLYMGRELQSQYQQPSTFGNYNNQQSVPLNLYNQPADSTTLTK